VRVANLEKAEPQRVQTAQAIATEKMTFKDTVPAFRTISQRAVAPSKPHQSRANNSRPPAGRPRTTANDPSRASPPSISPQPRIAAKADAKYGNTAFANPPN
jgi:hypothetical protein